MPTDALRRSIATTLLAVAAAAAPGCYTAESLVERVRNRAVRSRIDEVPIGEFRVTLPRDERTSELNELVMRVFGQSVRYKINEIEQELEEKRYLVNDLAITTLRAADHNDLTEPDLDALRGRLLKAFNGVLTDAPLTAVGFYEVRIVRH